MVPAKMPYDTEGLSMAELKMSMKVDASNQEILIGIICKLLDESVERNDNLKVCLF